MSFFTEFRDFFSDLYDTLSHWFDGEGRSFLDNARKVQDEIEEIGKDVFNDAIHAGLASLAESDGNTGRAITAAVDIAIATLKAQGFERITAAVFAAVSTAIAAMHVEKATAS